MKLTRLFLIKAGKKDFTRTFTGTLVDDTDEDGNTIFRSSVSVNEGMMWSTGNTEHEVGDNLDAICLMKLDYNLHSNPGIGIPIFGTKFYLN